MTGDLIYDSGGWRIWYEGLGFLWYMQHGAWSPRRVEVDWTRERQDVWGAQGRTWNVLIERPTP